MEQQAQTILVVDDDTGLQELVRVRLEQEGYRVLQTLSGVEALTLIRKQRPDLVILDIMLPDLDGLTVCQRAREFSSIPILMLTAKSLPGDVITGLDQGADDYLVKPFNYDELLARIRALLRRVPAVNRLLTAGNGLISIDPRQREVRVRGELIDLTPTEYQLLLVLAEQAGAVVDHEQLLRTVWGSQQARDNDYLKVYIWHLRRKIELDPRNPQLLLTEWGIGYRLLP
ncbi:response regulator transcription factor [Chloroflexus sp.]|uniref:response regulator transcription factor n=1 Tax=Chloroflexus sp. TaxID=1904827 RepID=UPI0026192F60|nr:response regulator transcription factor [uncultured Chloroflexus sp.]